MKHILFFIAILFLQTMSYSQKISGTVVDNSGVPIPDVVVFAASTNENTTTDFDGIFSIKANPGDDIQFTMLGFEKALVKASQGMIVIMNDDKEGALDEVVLIGYGSKKAGAITGSVSQIKSDEILKTPSQSAIQSIQGKLAGVNIVTNDEPGANPSIQIRGLGTVLAGRDPLYVIDGVESPSLNGLSPNEIASMDILKDASSLAIYGQKGSNGVIIVTTKKGKEGKIRVSFESYFGIKQIQREVEMADSYRFAYYNNSALGSSSYFNFEQPFDTNWLDEITDTGSMISNFLSISGGSEHANYYLGYTNYQEEGILNGTEYDRNNFNSRIELKLLDDRLKISNSLNFSVIHNTPMPLSAFTNAYKQAPIMPVTYPNGRWGMPFINPQGINDYDGIRYNNVANPAAQLYFTNEENKNNIIFGSISAEFKIINDLKFTSNFGATYNEGKGYTYTPSKEIWLSQNPTQEAADYPESNPDNVLNQRKFDSFIWNWDNYFTYTKAFGKNDFTAVLGMSRSENNNGEYLSGTRNDVPEQSNYWYLDFSSDNTNIAPGAVVSNSHSTPVQSMAYFARADYAYDGKYLITASFRREGISSFQEDERWGNFPAVSAGWVISNEEFFNSGKSLNYLKLRGGYGEVANGNSGNSLNTLVFGSGYNYAFGPDQEIFAGANIPYQVDPSLSWETMKEYDLGLDFRMFNNRFSAIFDIYNRNSEDVILPVSLPPVLSPGPVFLNTGTVSNTGFEITLRWEDTIGENWRYFIGSNFSANENELQDVSNAYFANFIGGGLGNGQWTKQVLEGEALGSFYVYDVTGYNSTGAFTYSDERVVAGSYLPTYTYGINLGLNYKNLDFSTDLFGVGGNKLYNGKKAQRFGGENVENDLLDSFWTPSTPNAENPYPFNEVPIASSYYVEDGDYLRINNITLGYSIPNMYKKIDKFRIYVTAVNPFIFTDFTGFSPEISGNNNANPMGSAGIELDAYPSNRSFIIGLNLLF